jgi:hypothetical protein
MTGPTDVDHGLITLWSAADLEPASHNFAECTDADRLIVFADHSLHIWWYAIEAARPDGCPSRVFLLFHPRPTAIFPSLAAFLQGILDDDIGLYAAGSGPDAG